MVAFCRRLAAVWLIARASAQPEACGQEDGQCVTGDAFLQKGRERSAARVPLVALQEDEQDPAAGKTFIPDEPMKIVDGCDASDHSFEGPVIGGQATNGGVALAAQYTKNVGANANRAEYVFYVHDGSELRVAVVEVTLSGVCSLFAKTLAVKRGGQPNTAAGARQVAQSGTQGLFSPVHTGRGIAVGFVVGRPCGSSEGHCSRCSEDGRACLVCETGYVLDGYFCRKSCQEVSVNRDTSSALNIVLVPSGFKHEMDKWPAAVQNINAQFAAYPLLNANNIDQLNVFYVRDSALEDNGAQCWFGCKNIQRLLCCNNALFERHAWRTCGGGFHVQLIVVHNSDEYGGAGGRIATTSINAAAPKIAAHELGHSMFSLADEYTYGRGNANKPNCDTAGCPKWNDMIHANYPGVSCTPNHCKNGRFYASSSNTIMKALSGGFSPVQERDMCCEYLHTAGSAPPYCNTFNMGALPVPLSEYCETSLLLVQTRARAGKEAGSYNAGTTRYIKMNQPVEWDLVPQEDDPARWTCIRGSRLPAGDYPENDVAGDTDVPLVDETITVIVKRGNTENRRLTFNIYDTVEVPPLENGTEWAEEEKFEAPDRRTEINVVLEDGEVCEV